MPMPSIYRRPDEPRGFVLQARDRALLRHVATHRYLTSDHVHALAFRDCSKRVALLRLRRLWEHGYLDRRFLHMVLTGERVRQNNRPLYMLARRGAAVVANDADAALDELPQTPAQNAAGYATLAHHLVATDLLVAIEVACRSRSDVELVSVMREDAMRRRVAGTNAARREHIVSDGAFTLRFVGSGRECAFHLEVIRADVRGGNRMLRDKFEKYVRLHRQGFFERVFGHPPLRAVLVCTTSAARVENFLAMARSLPFGRRLFWFTAYEREEAVGVPLPAFRSETALDPVWRTVDGDVRVSLLDACDPRAPAKPPEPRTPADAAHPTNHISQ